MPKTYVKRKEDVRRGGQAAGAYEPLTRIAFVLALALVLARATLQDMSRDRGNMSFPGAPRAAGAATAIALDLLCVLPVILILARRVMDRTYTLRSSWAALPLVLLAGWGMLSVAWSADRFAALCMASHLLAAAALFWSAIQLVRSWLRLRLVASMALGLLLAYFMFALFYKVIDLPEMKSGFEKNKTEFLKQEGFAGDAFKMKQFEQKVLAGELMGFYISPNSMAAMVVLLLVVSLGLAAQRVADDRKDSAGIILGLIAAGTAIWMIVQTRSKTAAITPVLALLLAAAAWRWRKGLAARSKRAFWIGAGVVALGTAAVVGHGLFHRGLPGTSLTFRWYYWVGAIDIFKGHPLLGVGLDNFGGYYPQFRLPAAAEDVKDPHNIIVKYLTELGIAGAVLCIAWLGRIAWELTRPIAPAMPLLGNIPADPAGGASQYKGPRVITIMAIIVGLALAINVLAGTDFTTDPVYVLNEVLKKVGMYSLLLIGASLGAIKSLQAPELDARPAPLLLYAIIAALAVFVVHNLIDFSMSETGAMMFFALLAGSALGVRQPSATGRKRRTAAAALALGGCIIAWLIGAGFVWVPTAIAADAAHDADIAGQTHRPNEAMRLFMAAYDHQPLNADYPFRAAQAAAGGGNVFNPSVPDLLALAIKNNPRSVDYPLMRAQYLLHSPDPAAHRARILDDLRRVVELDPAEASLRLQYADALASFKTPADRAQAIHQYQETIRYNDMLRPDEPKRLGESSLNAIRGKINALQSAGAR